MFPNFTSLAQREQKRQELLERAERRVRQAKAKRLMYEGTSWATDVSNSISTLSSKTSTSAQTDSSEPLKKTLIDENSRKNPELSSVGINTDPLDVNVRPIMVDAETTAKPVMSDAEVYAKPQTANAEATAKPHTMDVGIETVQGTEIIRDSEEQVASREWIVEFFKANPNWAALGIHPVKRNGSDDVKRVIRKNGSIRSVKTGQKYKKYDSFDWIATEAKIRDILYDGESNSIDENGAMHNEDKAPRSDRKRKGEYGLEDHNTPLKDPRLYLQYLNKSTSTKLDADGARTKLIWFIIHNKDLLEANNLQKSINPILKDNKIYKKGYLWLDANFRIYLFGNDTNKHRPTVQGKIDWIATLERFVSMAKDKGLKLVSNTEMDKSKISKTYEPADANIDDLPGIKTGKDEDMDKTLPIPELEAKKILTEYYMKLADNQVEIAVRLRPIIDSEKGEKIHPTYYLGQPTRTKPLCFRNAQQSQVKGDAMAHLMKKIRWMDTFQSLLTELEDYGKYVEESEDRNLEKILNKNLVLLREAIFSNVSDVIAPLGYDDYADEQLKKLHDEAEEAFEAYGKAYSQYEKDLRDKMRSNSKSDKYVVRASRAAMKATKAAYAIKFRDYNNLLRERGEDDAPIAESLQAKVDRANTRAHFQHLPQGSGVKSRLKGRGLKGAGVAPLEGVVRRGRTYNLNEIQGLATPSAYVYKQLGSKYIRLPELDSNTLVIVQPNRRKCGPKCQISDSLQAMIKILVYKQHIDQSSYDKLTIDDKKMFKEILAITHLQYNFHDKLEDPLETLRAEFDKLKGEMDLGNDNPSIIQQLKSISVDMYRNQLLSDKDFKEILARLL